MSYTSDLKASLMKSPPTDEGSVRAELSALLSSEAHFYMAEDEITCSIKTDSLALAEYIQSQIENTFSLSGKLNQRESKRFGRHLSYELVFEKAKEFLNQTETVSKSPFGFYNPILRTIYDQPENVQSAFLRGVFLGCGSVLDPEQNYHLEIDGPNDAITLTCAELLENFNIHAHIASKKRKSVLYIKDSQAILDFLNLIGAGEKAQEFKERIALKQVRGKINRQVNCETANMNKLAKAAGEEIEAIEFLINKGEFSKLDEKLQTAALMRLDQPSLSIGALAKGSQISRSTLYRRLKQVVKIAENKRDNYND